MRTPLVSVLLPAYNCAATLADAAESILQQTLADFELIIVNDGSTDDTAAVLDDLAARDPRVRPVHQRNGGIVNALNAALAVARGEFVARMDGDDRSHPERFAVQVAHLRAHPECVCVGTLFRLMNAQGDITSVQNPIRNFRQTNLNLLPPHVATLPHPSILLRRSLLQQLGGYRQGFSHAEDYDLFLRLAEVGPLGIVQQPLLDYRIHAGSLSSSNLERQVDSALRAWLCALLRRQGQPEPADPAQLPLQAEALQPLLGDAVLAQAVPLLRRYRVAEALHMRVGQAQALRAMLGLLCSWAARVPAWRDRRYRHFGWVMLRQTVRVLVGRV
ncbi:glycosyltransferase family 2 protein [Roseateles sp. BYS87W]|uniref:Glycosyltransferase family 2 protein n=1 Tax=Pelomonas baiyunensis TaxID=3299026 RepID=A0ABW7H3G6_9BURK